MTIAQFNLALADFQSRRDATKIVRPAWSDRVVVPGSAVQATYPVLAPLIEAAVPAASGGAMTAREIFERVGFSTINVTRNVLRAIVAEGRAEVVKIKVRQGVEADAYRRRAEKSS